ncbi:MAG: hypothetical protein MZV63_57540 [Marinilabiliales bacterium]|nr:hypothetical protein [Marinilabiliales bacterium]
MEGAPHGRIPPPENPLPVRTQAARRPARERGPDGPFPGRTHPGRIGSRGHPGPVSQHLRQTRRPIRRGLESRHEAQPDRGGHPVRRTGAGGPQRDSRPLRRAQEGQSGIRG